jgi:hypothetical protein
MKSKVSGRAKKRCHTALATAGQATLARRSVTGLGLADAAGEVADTTAITRFFIEPSACDRSDGRRTSFLWAEICGSVPPPVRQ